MYGSITRLLFVMFTVVMNEFNHLEIRQHHFNAFQCSVHVKIYHPSITHDHFLIQSLCFFYSLPLSVTFFYHTFFKLILLNALLSLCLSVSLSLLASHLYPGSATGEPCRVSAP